MIKVLQGDVRERLAELADDSFDCIVTSPPYWGLRDYGTAKWEGGSEECDHVVGEIRTGLGLAVLGEQYRGGGHKQSEPKLMTAKGTCPHCGARRIDNQIGLEPTLTEYLDTMVAVCRELRRVLKPSGTFWLNVGDSYAGGGGFSPGAPSNIAGAKQTTQGGAKGGGIKPNGLLKSKDLCMVPNRLAIRLQEDGWYVRSEIIWAKSNPMPESVTDRPTSSHEKIWLLTKSERYWYDGEPIREPISLNNNGKGLNVQKFGNDERMQGKFEQAKRQYEVIKGANCRNVWTIASQPYSEAHFATFPPELAERCIKAGCPSGGEVLDPFGGAGTTAMVADRLGRNCTLIELNADYVDLIKSRIQKDAGMFAHLETEMAVT